MTKNTKQTKKNHEGEMLSEAIKWLVYREQGTNSKSLEAKLKCSPGTITNNKKMAKLPRRFREDFERQALEPYGMKLDDFAGAGTSGGPDTVERIIVTTNERIAIMVEQLLEDMAEAKRQLIEVLKENKALKREVAALSQIMTKKFSS
jgi:hypothetical protein